MQRLTQRIKDGSLDNTWCNRVDARAVIDTFGGSLFGQSVYDPLGYWISSHLWLL